MEIINTNRLKQLCIEHKKKFEQIFPTLIKRLILSSVSSISSLRFPGDDDVWAPGFDGNVECVEGNRFVPQGKSVWELGTKDHSLKKINEDYEKRTRDSLGVDKNHTIFILVLPKIWAFNGSGTAIDAWENAHHDWMVVKVYDAPILCDWINSNPSVCAWLLEQFNQMDYCGFTTVEMAWNKLANITKPAFVQEMFCSCRDDEISDFWERIGGKNNKVFVKAATTIDAQGFVLSQLLSKKEYANTVIAVENGNAFRILSEMVHNKIFLLTYNPSGIVDCGENRIVICTNMEAISIKDAIELPALTKNAYEKALRKMGISDGDIVELFTFTHCNLRALARRIPGNRIEYQPDWAKIEPLNTLIPLIFLRSINRTKDKKLAEILSGYSFDRLEEEYYKYSKLEDAPVKIVNDYYVIVNYEEAWDTIGLSIDNIYFEKLTDGINQVFSMISQNGIFDGRPYYDFKSVIHNLLWNYIYYSYDNKDNTKLERAIDSILRWTSDPRVANYVISNLDILADSDHDIVMDFLNKDFENKNGFIHSVFSRQEYDRTYCEVLRALDILTLYSSTFWDACSMLSQLSLIEKTYHISNMPEESLLTALCLWRRDGDISIKQKEAFIKHMIKTKNEKLLLIASKLIGKNSFYTGQRVGEKRIQGEAVTIEVLKATTKRLLDDLFMIAMKLKNAEILKSLLANYWDVEPADLIRYAGVFSIEEYDERAVQELNYWLRETYFRCKRYQWEERKTYGEAFERWIKKTEFSDEIKAARWIFYKAYECPIIDIPCEEDDYEGFERKIYDYRKMAYRSLVKHFGDEAEIKLIQYMNDESYWGKMLSEIISQKSFVKICDCLLNERKYLILSAVLDNYNNQRTKEFLSKVYGEDREKLIPLLYNKCFLDDFNEEEKTLFWSKKIMTSDKTVDYADYLKYNPEGLLLFLYAGSKKNAAQYIEKAKEVFGAIILKKGPDKTGRSFDYIERIITCIDSAYYSDDWANLCMKLCSKMNSEKLPDCVQRYYFINPKELFMIEDDEEAIYVKNKFYLPQIAYENYAAFRYFFITIRDILDEAGREMSYIGRILGKTGVGIDECFPHEFTRIMLEEFDSREIDDEVAYWFDDLHRGRAINDGNDQRIKKNKYLKKSKELQGEYPHTAYVLKKISREYDITAKMDYEYSETTIG